MAGSSLRNAVQRRNHKERSQPVGRAKLGLLEKHKDYVLRAKDHHKKRDMLKRLTDKAAMRNKDEFYFGMINSSTRNGVHQHARPSEQLDNDVVALLKTQDVGYIRAALLAEKKRIHGLVERIAPSIPNLPVEWLDDKDNRRPTLARAGLIAAPGKAKKSAVAKIGAQGKKTVWLDDADALRTYTAPSASTSSTQSTPTTPRKESSWVDELSDSSDIEVEADDLTTPATALRKGNKHLGYLTTELASRYARLDQLQTAAEKLNLVRALMTHKGGHSSVVTARKNSLADKVARGTMTKNGLALTEEEEDEEGEATVKKVYKFSKERKR